MSRERAWSAAARVETEAVDAGFAALAATPRLSLDHIAAGFVNQLCVARKMRQAARA